MRKLELRDADDAAELFHCIRGLVEGGLLFGRELDLDDLLEALGTKFARNADVEAADAVLALKIGGAGEDLLLVLEDGFNHLDCGSRRSVLSRAGLEVLDDLGATVGGAGFKLLEAGGFDELCDGDAS